MKRAAISLLALLVLAGLLLWWFQPAQVVKRRTHSLLDVLTFDSGSGRSARQMGAYSLHSLLASEVTLESPEISQANGSFERQELESAYGWLSNHAKVSRFNMAELRSVTVDGDRARLECSVDALVELPDIRPADGRYDCSFEWIREDDGWRLAKAVWNAVEN